MAGVHDRTSASGVSGKGKLDYAVSYRTAEDGNSRTDDREVSDVDDDFRHLIRSARAAGHQVVIEPARCRTCGFMFGEDKLSKPGKCPSCRGTRIYEAQVSVSE